MRIVMLGLAALVALGLGAWAIDHLRPETSPAERGACPAPIVHSSDGS